MDFWDVVRARRMVRAFDPRPVDPAVIDQVIDAGRRAPSAGNSQGWSFLVLEGEATSRFWDVTLPGDQRGGFRWQKLLDAPVIVLPLA
ncbi:MAG: putative oxidoreductase, partial [Acidimicrobiia bacterium]|nr:putative oxidoreductase [Acidimicrobiia bacterium]